MPTPLANDPAISPALIDEHGITPGEYAAIERILGRAPTFTELGIFSVMWSEHCSYKNSRPLLKTLPTRGPAVLQGPGENAGVVDFGDGIAVAFKIESHNHPSAVEPYQGAATGIGGILRDIFTMGARPVALVDPLFFGDPSDPAVARIVRGVVHGIADYGNCVGVPTVCGMTIFAPAYNRNPLVNVMAVGTMRVEHLTRAVAKTPGAAVVYFGNPTGRDGVHGATFASVELTEESLERRGAIQVGDPFTGKKILEATLELIASGAAEAIQDMGAAGLTCSSCEVAGRGRLGMELDLDRVPQRAERMSPYEMMLSESQERMLAVVPNERLAEALAILARWEVGPAVVGRVSDDGLLRVRWQGAVVAEIPALAISEESPIYHREAREPVRPWAAHSAYRPGPWVETLAVREALLGLLAHPTIAEKAWATEQYDTMVRTDTVRGPGATDAAVLRVEGTHRLLAISCACDSLKVAIDPFVGAQMAVGEAARNLVVSGAKPLGLTNCLNFGNPEKPEQFWYLKRAVEGLGDMARRLGTPVTGGNVSLYNESDAGAVWPTPTIGMVGVVESVYRLLPAGFRRPGDLVFALGHLAGSLAGSWLAYTRDAGGALPGPLDTEAALSYPSREQGLQILIAELNARGLLSSAHDASEGGLAVAVAECAVFGGVGARIALPRAANRTGAMAALFGEEGALAVVSIHPGSLDDALRVFANHAHVPATELGAVTADAMLTLEPGHGDPVRIALGELASARARTPV